MAKKFIRLSYCDSVSAIQEEKIAILDSAVEAKKQANSLLKDQNNDLRKVVDLRGQETSNLNLIISNKDKQIRNLKFMKFLTTGLALSFGVIAVVR